jgi:hypothetical protein
VVTKAGLGTFALEDIQHGEQATTFEWKFEHKGYTKVKPALVTTSIKQ